MTDRSIPQHDQPEPNWKQTAPLDENVVANYHVTTRIDDRTIAFQHPVDDPFITHTVTLGWADLLRGLLRRRLQVTVLVGADTGRMDAVLNLDERTRRY